MPEQAVVATQRHNLDGSQLDVLFPPWHGGARSHALLSKRLQRQGHSVLQYTFHDQILNRDPGSVSESFRNIKDHVADDLHTIADEKRYEQIRLIGSSLGTPALMMVAAEFDRFDGATLIVPGSRLAPCLWEGSMTQHLRQEYESIGITDADELDFLWREIAPSRHVNALTCKDVTVVVSNRDNVIPSEYQHEFLRSLASADVENRIHQSRLGHYATIGVHCIKGYED